MFRKLGWFHVYIGFVPSFNVLYSISGLFRVNLGKETMNKTRLLPIFFIYRKLGFFQFMTITRLVLILFKKLGVYIYYIASWYQSGHMFRCSVSKALIK